MAYSDFTLENVGPRLGLEFKRRELFPRLVPVTAPSWLLTSLQNSRDIAFNNEKSRSEFLIAPILLAARQLHSENLAIYSGQRLTADAAMGLDGECDFILAATESIPILRAPLVTIVEAKKQDMDQGIGQCAPQMLAARMFNEKQGRLTQTLFGCVTTGNDWQFLRIDGSIVTIDTTFYYLGDVNMILAAILAAVAEARITI